MLTFIFIAYSCKKEIADMSISQNAITLNVGSIYLLTVSISPSNATNKNVSWVSSDTAIAAVSMSGQVTGIGPGNATITVTSEDGNKVATCVVTVLKWNTYTSFNSSLVNNSVNCIAIDNEGNKWFSYGINGGAGVTKFDGTNWTAYNSSNSGLASNEVTCIAIDKQGNKWFGTSGSGITKFDGTNWTIYNSVITGLNCGTINSSFADDKGNLWFGTDLSVIKYDGASWTNYLTGINTGVNCLAIDSSGNLWLGNSQGVIKYNGTNLIKYLSGSHIYSLCIDKQWNKWFGTSWGLWELTKTGWVEIDGYLYTHQSTFNGQPLYTVSIANDKQGNIWFGCSGIELGSGINKFDGKNWTNYTIPTYNSGIDASVSVNCISIDNNGNKWFAWIGGITELQD